MTQSQYPRMHVSLYVDNLVATVAFYDTFFGKPADKIKAKYAKYILSSPSLIISFVENPERTNPAFRHFGFQVESKEEMESRLVVAKKQGIVFKEEMDTACCFAIQDKFWVKDPDGIQWEVYYFHKDSEFNDPTYSLVDASACCTPASNKIKSKANLIESITNPQDQEKGCC